VAPVEERDMKAALTLCEARVQRSCAWTCCQRAANPRPKLRKHADEQNLRAAIWLEPQRRRQQRERVDQARRSARKDQSAAQIAELLRASSEPAS